MDRFTRWIIQGNRIEIVFFTVIAICFFCVMFYACNQMTKALP
jgi:hypothetical protein